MYTPSLSAFIPTLVSCVLATKKNRPGVLHSDIKNCPKRFAPLPPAPVTHTSRRTQMRTEREREIGREGGDKILYRERARQDG